MVLAQLKHQIAVDMVSKSESEINLVLTFLIIGCTDLIWTCSVLTFSVMLLLMFILSMSKITFSVQRTYEFQIDLLKLIIRKLCKSTKELESPNTEFQEISKIFEMTRNSKYLSNTDPKRFKYSCVKPKSNPLLSIKRNPELISNSIDPINKGYNPSDFLITSISMIYFGSLIVIEIGDGLV